MSYLNKNLQGRKRVQKNVTGTLDLDNNNGGTGPTGATGSTGPATSFMEPLIPGTTHGQEDLVNSILTYGNDTNPSKVGINNMFIGINSFASSNPNKANSVSIGNRVCTGDAAPSFTDRSVLIGNNILSNRGSNRNKLIGSELLRSQLPTTNTFNNIIMGDATLGFNDTGNINNNIMLGNSNYINNTNNSTNLDFNLIIGSNIETANTNDIKDNILIGRNMVANPSNSIVIHRGSNNFTADYDNMFYLGNNSDQPTEKNEFIISNNYTSYKVKGIPSPITNIYYFNYSITAKNEDGSNTVDPQTSNGPYPNDPFNTYKDLSQGPAVTPLVTFPTLVNPGSPLLLSDYAFITPVNNPGLTSWPAGSWTVKFYASTTVNNAISVTPRFYAYDISGVEYFKFNGLSIQISGATQTLHTSVIGQGAIPGADTERLVVKLFAEATSSAVVTLYLDGDLNATLETPFIEEPINTNFILHYDYTNGNITKQIINNTNNEITAKKILKRDTTGRTLFRTFTEGSGILINEFPNEINIGLDTAILPVDMEPTVSGLAYGKQDQGILFTGLGRELVPKDRSISLFNQAGSGDIQNYNGTDNILINNIDNQNSNTNAVMSNIITNNCVTKDCNFDHSTLLASELDMAAIGAESCTLIGNFKGQVIGNCREAMYITNNAGPTNLNLNGRQSLYLGNATFPETVNDRDAYISGYDRFYLRSLRQAPTTFYAYYDPSTSEITYDVPIPVSNVNWQPTTLGSYYGKPFTLGDPQNMVAGYLSFPNLTTNDSTCLGNFNFPTQPNTVAFSNNVLVGNTNQWSPTTGVERSIFVSGELSSNNLRNVSESFWSSTQNPNLGAVTDMNNSIIIHPAVLGATGGIGTNSFNNTISLVTGKNNDLGSRNIIISNGATNTLINSSPVSESIILCNRDASVTMPSLNNFCYIGDGTSLPTANNSFNASHTTLRMPNLGVLTGNTVSGNVRLLGYDTSTGLISPYLTNTFSRVYRQQANTNAAGVVVFNTGTTVANVPGTTYHAQVINTSTTNAYICQTSAVTASTVKIQVFVTQTILLGGQPVTTAPANIVVSFSMNY